MVSRGVEWVTVDHAAVLGSVDFFVEHERWEQTCLCDDSVDIALFPARVLFQGHFRALIEDTEGSIVPIRTEGKIVMAIAD